MAENREYAEPEICRKSKYELTMFGDLKRVEDKARQLEDMDAEYASFVHKLDEHIKKYEDEPILELLEYFMKSKS